MAKVAIVGFGLVGRVAALMLSKTHALTIFEADDERTLQSAGTLAAAMLAPMAESVICEADLALRGLESMTLWQTLLAELDDTVMFQQQGTLVVAHQQDKGDLLSFQQRLKPLQEHSASVLNATQVGQFEPELAGRFTQGLFLPCEGQLDNLAFYTASYRALLKQNVVFHFNVSVSKCPQSLNGEDFDWIIDCRGIGAKEVMQDLRGVRGEVARIYARDVSITRPVRLMHPRYPIYIAPKPNHEFVIGATEIESQDAGPVTVRSTLELLSAAYTVHSGFAEGRVLALRSGLRPAFKDNRPRISRHGNVIEINGLYRHGFLLAPSVVREALSEVLL
ncbi:FAD-binding oxidoreductase [Pseudoalteromonas xiamenensis]|uniref:FAD-dependent oxidoreductase n=1 Tax=Pseudoalteromonas xiamenensis TaxID=882626 RepID=UPI0027E4CDF1|nr:FAD-dependent oxidoreductase [Pseudoalteromonas xiamenensis]WMN58837.1 FAD-binding oxidoreductase [Pseudoalteromonas xiamenensis]